MDRHQPTMDNENPHRVVTSAFVESSTASRRSAIHRSLSRMEALKVVIIMISVITMISIQLIPYAKNGFWFDDSLNSQIWGMVNRFHVSVWDFSLTVIRAWLRAGRILFCWPAIYTFFYFVRDELAVRLIDLALLLTHVSLIIVLLRQLRLRWSTIGLFTILLFPLFQIRDTHDPLASYAGFCQSLGIALAMALILLNRWCGTGKFSALIASSVIGSLSMTWYEINVVYIPIALFAIASLRPRDWRVGFIVVLVPSVVYLVASAWIKHHSPSEYPGSSVGASALFLPTYFKQLLAAFPGTFYGLVGSASLHFDQLLSYAAGNVFAVLASILWIVSFILTLTATEEPIRSAERRVAIFTGAILLLAPPSLIAMSSRYQHLITWGSAHIPVYYQYYGLAILATTSLERSFGTKARMALIVSAPVFAIWVGLNWSENTLQSEKLDIVFRKPRDSFVLTLKKGILDPVRTVISSRSTISPTSSMAISYTKKPTKM